MPQTVGSQGAPRLLPDRNRLGIRLPIKDGREEEEILMQVNHTRAIRGPEESISSRCIRVGLFALGGTAGRTVDTTRQGNPARPIPRRTPIKIRRWRLPFRHPLCVPRNENSHDSRSSHSSAMACRLTRAVFAYQRFPTSFYFFFLGAGWRGRAEYRFPSLRVLYGSHFAGMSEDVPRVNGLEFAGKNTRNCL